MPQLPEILILVAVGLTGGCFGGFLGIGGSVIFIPVLKALGFDAHSAVATALVINVLVSSGGARGHLRSGKVRQHILIVLIPVAIGAAVVGVLIGNQFIGDAEVWIWRIFGLLMVYVIAYNAARLWREFGRDEHADNQPPDKPGRLPIGIVGGLMGLSSGFLGIGGGAVGVPGLQVIARRPLRVAVANSAITMIFSCALAAVVKQFSLPSVLSQSLPDVPLAEVYFRVWTRIACLGPPALIGGYIGSHITHRMKRHWVRIVFMLFLALSAYNMLFVKG